MRVFLAHVTIEIVLLPKNMPWEKKRWIVLIKIITHKQLWAHWETYNKAEMACLFSLCWLHSSKVWMSSSLFICEYSSALSSFASCTSLPELVFDIQKPSSFLPFWIIEIHLLFSKPHEEFWVISYPVLEANQIVKLVCKVQTLRLKWWRVGGGSLIALCYCLNCRCMWALRITHQPINPTSLIVCRTQWILT